MFRRDVCAQPVPCEKINNGIPLSSFIYMECDAIYCKYVPHRTSNTILMITIGRDAMFHHHGVTDKVLSHNSKTFVFMYYTICMSDLLCPGGGESETELVVSSTAQGPAKNTIDKDRVDVLLNDDCMITGNYFY